MQEQIWPKILRFYWKNILIGALAVALVALIFSLIQPFEYRGRMRFVISQRQFGFNQDAYAAAKSAEKLARNIADTISSGAFLEDVLNSGFGVERDIFPQDEAKKRKAWEEKISAETQTDSGLLTIKVYDTDKDRVLRIAEAVTYVLNTKGADYHGGSRDVQIKRIDDPLVSKWPARPNLPVNVASGLALGALAAAVFYFLKGAPTEAAINNGKWTEVAVVPVAVAVEAKMELKTEIAPVNVAEPEKPVASAEAPVAPVRVVVEPPENLPIAHETGENFWGIRVPEEEPEEKVTEKQELPDSWLFKD